MKRLARRFSAKLGDDVPAQRNSMDSDEAREMQQTWGVTEEQEWQLVAQLRDEVELEAGQLAPEFDDYAVRRFLRARKHNILKAKTMLLDTLKWRQESGVDSVLTSFVFPERQEFGKWYPEGYYGITRDGRPIYIQQPGKIDTEELWKFTTMERCITYHLQQQERFWRIICPVASLVSERHNDQCLMIVDCEGMGISTLTGEVRKILAQLMQIDQDYYPELMWKCYIINAPTTFRVIWSMVKYLMDARTQAKFEVLGADYQQELLRLVAPENLMQAYGGTCTAPLCAEPGPWKDPAILERFYAQRRQQLEAEGRQEGMTWPSLVAALDLNAVPSGGGSPAAAAAPGGGSSGGAAEAAEGAALAVAS